MTLVIGDAQADGGMANAIFDVMYTQLGGAFEDGPPDEVVDGWRKLSHAIAAGVVGHLQAAGEARLVRVADLTGFFTWVREVDRIVAALRVWADAGTALPADLLAVLVGEDPAVDRPPSTPPAPPAPFAGDAS